MVSTVLRPNHYELLGLTPDASATDIVQAFAKELGLLRPRAFGTLAEVTVAYETLKDPIKRGAYDAAIGLKAETAVPAPEVPPEWAPFLVRASARPVEKPAIPLPGPLPQINPQPWPEALIQSSVAPLATASMRDPLRQTTHPTTHSPGKELEVLRGPEKSEDRIVESLEEEDRPFDPAEEYLRGSREPSIDWKQTAMALAWPILAIAVFGAVAGWSAGIVDQPPQEEQPLTIPLPPAKSSEAMTVEPTVPDSIIPEIAPEPQARPATGPSQITQARPPLQIDLPEEQAEPAESDQPVEITPEPVVAKSTAAMPLPKSVIASTIRRIGYPCSEVTSTTEAEGGAPGVFTVTCASGQSYRAAPVHGRYRFRRISGR